MRGGRGGRVASLDVSRASAEAGGGRRVAGTRRARAPAFWREEDDDWQGQSARPSQVGWASTGKAQVASLSLFFYLFLFFYLTATVGLY